MEKFGKRALIISVFVVSAAIALVLITFGLAFSDRNPKEEPWVLHSYGNNVALYKGDDVVEVYGSIVLDTLPEEDKRLLNSGISFLTKEEAKMAIEDYDG